MHRNFAELKIRRAFTSIQLMMILDENHYGFLIAEHDPLLYKDAGAHSGVRGPGPEADL